MTARWRDYRRKKKQKKNPSCVTPETRKQKENRKTMRMGSWQTEVRRRKINEEYTAFQMYVTKYRIKSGRDYKDLMLDGGLSAG